MESSVANINTWMHENHLKMNTLKWNLSTSAPDHNLQSMYVAASMYVKILSSGMMSSRSLLPDLIASSTTKATCPKNVTKPCSTYKESSNIHKCHTQRSLPNTCAWLSDVQLGLHQQPLHRPTRH